MSTKPVRHATSQTSRSNRLPGPRRLHRVILAFTCAALLTGCNPRSSTSSAPTSSTGSGTATQLRPLLSQPPAGTDASSLAIRFWSRKALEDPYNHVALNRLAAAYLTRMEDTGDLQALERARQAAHASLEILGADANPGALGALARVELAAHEFTAARDHAQQWTTLAPRDAGAWSTLGDALQELGDYEGTANAYGTMQRVDEGAPGASIRLARLAELHGRVEEARRHLAEALRRAEAWSTPSPSTIAWCHWVRGELEFNEGRYAEAEKQYRTALKLRPDYPRGLLSLARLRAAMGDLQSAVKHAHAAQEIVPDPVGAALLGDLLERSGKKEEAAGQYALVEQIGRLEGASDSLYSRHLSLFRADHDRDLTAAYEAAKTEWAVRKDLYGADALAWTALKAGRVAEAQTAIRDALRLGTRDARLLYHAGMIARAAGDRTAARDHLARALRLNPGFDPLQAPKARAALEALNRPAKGGAEE